MPTTTQTPSAAKAWIITRPTSGIGYRTALELAKHGTVVLVGRNPEKLSDVEKEIEARAGTPSGSSLICPTSRAHAVPPRRSRRWTCRSAAR